MDSVLVNLINRFYRYVKISLAFWLFTFKGMVIYGLIPSIFALFSSMKEIDLEENDDIFKIYKKYYSNYKHLKFVSFGVVFVLILLYSVLFFISIRPNIYSDLLKVIVIYLMSLIVLLVSYGVYINVYKEYGIKESLVNAFLISVRYFGVSIIYIVFIGVYLNIAKINLVLMLSVHPFFLVLVVKFIFEKILPRMGLVEFR